LFLKIPYRYKKYNFNLILGVIWFLFSLTGIVFKVNPEWTDYVWFILSLMYFGLYYYEVKYNYVEIKEGFIKVNGPLGKKLKLNEITTIKHFAGSYILKSKQNEITVELSAIDDSYIEEFKRELKKLEVEWK